MGIVGFDRVLNVGFVGFAGLKGFTGHLLFFLGRRACVVVLGL